MKCDVVGGITLGTIAMDMGRTTRGGPTNKIKACTARQLKDILAIKEDLFGYDRYRIPCKYLLYSRIDLDLNQPVTLPSRLYKAGRDPLECISYSIQSTKDTGRRVLRRLDGLNQSKSLSLHLCHHPVPITCTSTDHLLPWVYPSVDCLPDFIDSGMPGRGCAC